jgi:hypothetical protein
VWLGGCTFVVERSEPTGAGGEYEESGCGGHGRGRLQQDVLGTGKHADEGEEVAGALAHVQP